MFKAYQALMLILAQSTEKELAAQVQFLKAENETSAASKLVMVSAGPVLKLGPRRKNLLTEELNSGMKIAFEPVR